MGCIARPAPGLADLKAASHMSAFLQLPEGSPAAPLMASMVRTCDLLAEDGHMLGPDLAQALLEVLAIGAQVLQMRQSSALAQARAALDSAGRS